MQFTGLAINKIMHGENDVNGHHYIVLIINYMKDIILSIELLFQAEISIFSTEIFNTVK